MFLRHTLLIFSFLLLTLSFTWNTAAMQPKQEESLKNSLIACGNANLKSSDIEELIRLAGFIYKVDPQLIEAVIRAESNWNVCAVSSAGAVGLMQLMPATAKELGVDNVFDPITNIIGGTRYLRRMYDLFGSLRSALIAYNWGPGNLEKYGEHMIPDETRQYLLRVTRFYGRSIN